MYQLKTTIMFAFKEKKKKNRVLESNFYILLNSKQRYNALFFCIHKRQPDCNFYYMLSFHWITILLSFKSEDWFLQLSLTILESKRERKKKTTSSGAVIFAEKNLLQNINQIFRLLGNHMV